MESFRKLQLESSFEGTIIEIREGASGIVYIVDHGENHHPRKVAYKTFREKFEIDDVKKQHFLEECIKWLKLNNQYIVTPFFAKIIGGRPYICMPYCTTDLKKVMLNHSFTRVEALVVITQLVKALLSFEQKGFSQHQDLNPPNIMLIDLKEKFPGCPTRNFLGYQVKVSDFGMIDLYRILGPSGGLIGGKFAFKAPEQYEEYVHSNTRQSTHFVPGFKPDTFALGIIMYMLFTGRHPNGLPVAKALKKNTSGSIFKKWALDNPSIEMSGDIFEGIINGCLTTDPIQRPLLDDILEVCKKELYRLDQFTYENLILRFDQNDYFNAYHSRAHELHTLGRIAELPKQRDIVLADLKVRLEQNIIDPEDVEYFARALLKICELANTEDNLDEYLLSKSRYLIELVHIWYDHIRIHHLYPPLKSADGQSIPVLSDLRDVEAMAYYLSIAFSIIERAHGAEGLLGYINTFSNRKLLSIYHYYNASNQRQYHGDFERVVDSLDLAIENNPEEEFFRYIKQLWTKYHNEIKSAYETFTKKKDSEKAP